MACRDVRSRQPGYVQVKEYTCIVCDKPFTAKHLAKYCSLACRSQGAKLTVRGFLRHLLKHRGRHKLLSLDDLVAMYDAQQGRCAISDRKMTIGIRGGRNYQNVSIDRIDSSKGYSIENVHLVCLAVNLMKLDMTQAQFVAWCSAVSEASAHHLDWDPPDFNVIRTYV